MLPKPTNSILSAWSGFLARNDSPVSRTHFCRSGWPQGIQKVTTLAPAGIVGVGAVGVPPETPAWTFVCGVPPDAASLAAASAGLAGRSAGLAAASAGLAAASAGFVAAAPVVGAAAPAVAGAGAGLVGSAAAGFDSAGFDSAGFDSAGFAPAAGAAVGAALPPQAATSAT